MGEYLIKSFSSSFFADLAKTIYVIINRIKIKIIVNRGKIFSSNKRIDKTQNKS